MPKFITRLILALIVSCIAGLQPAVAVKIVRMDLEYGSDSFIATGGFDIPYTRKNLDLELFDDDKPITVTNYLNYVSNGLYTQTFFSRSDLGLIIQTGGYTNKPTNPESDPLGSAFAPVEPFAPIDNEPGLPNIRGTISMAKYAAEFVEGGDCEVEGPNCTLCVSGGGNCSSNVKTGPDSATSEWFVNVRDVPQLDTDNGGFTVFGSVIDDGMDTVDQISDFPTTNISFLFPWASTLPLADDHRSAGETLLTRNLIMVLTVTEINRPILRFAPAISNFGFEPTGITATGKEIDVVLRNTGNEILDISAIDTGPLGAPFSITNENCTFTASLVPVSVDPASQCTISLLFLPTSLAVFEDDLIIEYTGQTSAEVFSVKYPLIGEGALAPPVITVANTFNVGTSQVGGFSTTKNIVVENSGVASLQIADISISSPTNFTQTNDCVANDPLIAPGETCTVSVNFTTNDFSVKSAILSIDSNDPVNGVFNITLSGYGDSDADGVLSAIEDAAPNVGDNNFDGILDSKQNNIASPVSTLGDYITLVVDNKYVVSNIAMTSTAQLSDLPSDVEFKYGDIGFQIDAVPPGASIEVGLILPAVTSKRLTGYYFFGVTADNATPRWYPYESIQLVVNGKLGGSQSARDFIKVLVQDGGPGDADQEVNGRILLAHSAPAYSTNASSSNASVSSSMNFVFLGFFVVLMLAVKRRRAAD